MSDKKTIVVTGYPKSGNTWIARLVAELVGCPINGFWSHRKTDDRGIEELDRISDYCCYKSHDQYHECSSRINDITHLVYVVRDPRDIVISGAHYFKFKGIFPNSLRSKIKKMFKTVLNGRKKTHYYCRIPWSQHVKPFIENNIFYVKYENMLLNPKEQCLRICEHLKIKVSEQKLLQAIENQSFGNKKEFFKKIKNFNSYRHLRSGKMGEWKTQLSKVQINRLTRELNPTLDLLGYTDPSS